LTLPVEIKFIWFSAWSYTKVLFLVLRYTPFIWMCFFLNNQLFVDPSIETCKVTFPAQPWMTLLQVVLAEVILAVRTWAVWNRDKAIGTILVVSIITVVIPQCVLLNKFVHSVQYLPTPYTGFRGCIIITNDRMLWINYAMFASVEAIFLLLMAISASQSYRQGNFNRLTRIIHIDGMMFYVYLLCISVANAVTVIALPINLIYLLTPIQYLLYSVLTARIMLNIRDIGNRPLRAELHSVYQEPPPASIPLQFVHQSQDTTPDSAARSQSLRK